MALHHRLANRIAGLYWRLRRPRTLGVRALALDAQGRVALVRHTYTPQWYLPGGGVKKGESFHAAVVRELKEEVALGDAVIERVLGVYHSRREGKDDHIVVFVAHAPASRDLQAADALEIEEARWFPLDALPADTSPATLRRIAEYRSGAVGLGVW
jgi:ADP-ribose pyrophosphatase YjhB (NUDIX family)